MDIVKIQALIAQGRVVKVTDIDPANSFVQIGVYQPDNRKIGSANNTYPPFVIPLSELGGNQDLATTLAIGNTTGANWIDVDSGYGLTGDDGGTISSTIKIDPLNSNPIHSQVLDTSNYHNSNIKQTPEEVIIYTMDNDAAGPSITVGLTTITIRSFDNPVLIEGNTAEYAVDYSSIYTNRSLVDKEYVDASVSGVLDDRGNWDASGNVYPSTGGSGPLGTILKGDLWFVSVPGTLGGNPVLIGSNFRALIDNPLLSTDWNILNSGVGYIPENIANKGIPNGYAELDVTGKVPLAQLPSFSIIVKLTKALNGPVVTGTTSNTMLDSLLIPANTFKVGMAKINIRNVWTTSAVTKASRIYINTTNSLVGATLIGLATSGSGARSVDMGRILAIKSLSSFEVYGLGTMVAAESQLSTNVVDITYDATVNNYIIVSIVQGVADSCLNSYINFEI
jgi:hypothetical protein